MTETVAANARISARDQGILRLVALAITERGFCVDLSKSVTFPISSECWQGTRECFVLNRVDRSFHSAPNRHRFHSFLSDLLSILMTDTVAAANARIPARDQGIVVLAITELGFCGDLSKSVTFAISSECWQGTRESFVLKPVGKAVLIA
ncbi:hypothetical protein CDAR_206351 [Caerostris darwini]|uniref:Uncharacterized protein n=1 Tax=Caerostris darwini TaxID=1538125 RepID=A0AAV4RN48_9ARAC|nr:hypothetical protein CDAR_206351 [Caerostris darwini]